MSRPLLIVDGANVMGSVPDGWWRDRVGAAGRLRDELAMVAAEGLPVAAGRILDESAAGDPVWQRPVEVVLVLEGAARGVPSTGWVAVLDAPGSGDDAIVDLVRERSGGRPCAVATADRGLIDRVRALGAQVIGPRAVRYVRFQQRPGQRPEQRKG